MALKVQQLGRSMHTSSSGMDITRTLYVKPYAEFPDVLEALQGKVEKKGDKWERTPPARDTYVRNAYCNEAITDFAHPDSASNIEDFEEAGGNLIDQLQDVPETTISGSAGAKIVAHYRPLITAWQPSVSPGEDPQAPGFEDKPDDDIWDWMDPQFVPGILQKPWPGGIFAKAPVNLPGAPAGVARTVTIPEGVTEPYGIIVSDFSIKRILVGEIPHNAIATAANAVNKDVWPDQGSPAANGLPQFHPKTLKFAGTTVKNMMDSKGRRWVELTHNFKWLQHPTDRLFDKDGQQKAGWVTWNHAFFKPRFGLTAWYQMFAGTQFTTIAVAFGGLVASLALEAGKLHNEVDFTPLFKLNPDE